MTKSKKLLVWILAALVLLAGVAAALVLMLGPSPKGEDEGAAPAAEAKLYWNVEKSTYSGENITRSPRSDGYYYIRFAVDGEQVDIPAPDYLMTRYIDTMEVMGLELDENGVISRVLRVDEFAGKILLEDYYVEELSDSAIVCNATGIGTGHQVTVPIDSQTQIYKVNDTGDVLCGLPGQLQVGSQILAVADHSGKVTHIYGADPFEVGDIYWNVSREYDSSLKLTTRTPNTLGLYEYVFAKDGQQVTLYTRDIKVASKIDSYAAKCMGLVFDEDGYITDTISTQKVTGKGSFGSWYHAVEIDGDVVHAKKLTQGNNFGNEARGTMAPDCKIYDVSGQGAYVGEPTQLRKYDQIHGLRNPFGQIIMIFVVGRSQEVDIYWNVERQWNSTAKATTRIPNAQGYYEILLAVNGQQKTFKTKDKTLVDAMDRTAVKCFGLKVEGDEILAVYPTHQVWGGRQFCSWDDVISIQNGTVTAKEMDQKKEQKNYEGPMTEDCKVYDVTGNVTYVGAYTTLQVGDKIHALKDASGNVTHIFVVERAIDAKIYYNVSRQWDSKAKSTTRTPNAEGYYEILLAVDGQQKLFKTKDKALVDQIDEAAARCVGLWVTDDVITRVFAAPKVKGGIQFCSYDFVTDISGSKVTAQEADAAKGNKTYIGNMTAACGVYDVTGQVDYVGVPTTLKVGDKIHALKDKNGNITYIFVVGRSIEAPIVWNVSRKWDSKTSSTTRTPNAEGFYEIVLAVDGQQKTYKTKDKALVDTMDGTATRCFGIWAEGDIITHVFDASKVVGGAQFCSYDIVTDISGSKVTAQEADASKGNQTYIGNMTAACGVYDVTGQVDYVGVPTTLKVGDKIHALKDQDGNITYIFVVGRSIEAPIVWNVSRKWDSKTSSTTRTPNAEGYYEIVLAVDGQQKTYKTKDKALVNTMDGTATRCFGIWTEGDTITHVFETTKVAGGLQFCSYDVVTEITAQGQVTAKEADASKGDQTYVGVMTGACGVYNVSSNAAVVGEKTTLLLDDVIHALKNELGQITCIYVVERIEKAPEKSAYCDLCGQNVTWYGWDGAAALEVDHHYYLYKNINQAKTAYIGTAEAPAGTVTLDLCGYEIQASQRAFRVYGTLNLLDSGSTGTIYGNASGQATGFYVYDAGTFNMYGGTFVGGAEPNTQNGIGAAGLSAGSQAVFNMYGGCLRDGNTEKDGANLHLYHSATFNMYGGTISGGKTLTSGGSIGMSENAFMNLYGGTIGMGQADVNGDCVNALGTVKLVSGNPIQVAQLRLGEKKLILEGTLTEGSQIGVVLAAGRGIFTETTAQENLPFFTTDGEDTVAYTDGCMEIQAPVQPHKHCLCGGVGEVGDHETCTEVEWIELTQPMVTTPDGVTVSAANVGNMDGTALADGYYYLGGDLTLEALVVPAGADVKLCLNGHTIEASQRAFQLEGTLTLCDCENSGTVTCSKVRQAPVFYVRDGGVFNLYGGTLKGTKKVSSAGGVGALGISANGGAVMNQYGGTVTGGETSANGGNLVLYHDSVLNLYGGTISDGIAASGGNVLVDGTSAKLNVAGGTISGGVTSGAGGNIRISRGHVKLSAGTISGGTTTDGNGGSIFITGSTASMEMTGGLITGGTAGSGNTKRSGGNIYVASSAKLTVQDDPETDGIPEISGGTVDGNHGGNIYHGGAQLILSGVKITGGTATNRGANVYLNVSGAVLEGLVNICDADKENITLASGKTLTVKTLAAGSQIGITMVDGTGTVGTFTDAASVAYLKADDTEKSIETDGTNLKLS